MGRITCRECGAALTPDGDCEFCDRYERIMASAPQASDAVEFFRNGRGNE